MDPLGALTRSVRKLVLPLSALLLQSLSSHAGAPGKQVESSKLEAIVEDEWKLKLALPSWIATTRGDSGINGNTSHSNVGFNEIANKLDMVGGIRGELWKGRLGLLADFSYLSLSDSIGVDRAIRKVDVQADQILSEVALAWRVVDTPRATLEIIGGVRYTYLHEAVKLQGEDRAIRRAANRLAVAGPLVGRVLDGELGEVAKREQQQFARPALSLENRRELGNAIEEIRENTSDRAEKIEQRLKRALNRRVSRTDDWFDPFIGIRGKRQMTEKLYILGRADVSPLGVGSDFAWQASAGCGLQLTQRVTCEVVYRILDVEYRHNGLIYDITTHGPEATIGITF